MTDIVLKDWKRYGKHFTFVTGPNGEALAKLDHITGDLELHAEAAGRELEIKRLLNIEAADGSRGTSVTTSQLPISADVHVDAAPPDPAASASIRDDNSTEWDDLSENVPGQGVRAEATAEWQASKDRSKFVAYGARLFNVHTEERAWRVGAEGEEYIGQKLNKLRDQGWRVLHSIPVGAGDSDIDHIVIGPGGVFTLNSKNHPGKKIWVAEYRMMVNGQKVDYLRNAKHEAARASKLLSAGTGIPVEVRSCVVVLTGTLVPEITFKSLPKDVAVLDKWDVPRWFKKLPPVLDESSVEAVFETARKSTTWKASS